MGQELGHLAAARHSVCVFCASSESVDVAYMDIAAELGAAIANQGWRLVYGAGDVGLMGSIARAALAAGGEVLGVIPERLADREIALLEVTELIRTHTMRERKAIMDARSDAFVILPGGIGTLEELVEILTLKQLGFHERPVVLLDAGGYWQPLLALLERMVAEGFSPPSLLDLWTVAHDVNEVIAAVRADAGGAAPTPSAVLALEAGQDRLPQR